MWTYYKIYYYNNQDKLLNESIFKGLSELSISDFFFIRYWEGGPHIRLRIREKNNTCKINRLFSKIQQYLNDSDSKVNYSEVDYKSISKYLEKIDYDETSMIRVEDNSIISSQYIPEIEKYGKNGIAFAEKEFIFSSNLIRIILNKVHSRKSKIILSSLFQKKVIATVLRMTEYQSFFRDYQSYWKMYMDLPQQELINKEASDIMGIISESNFQETDLFFTKIGLGNFYESIFLELARCEKNIPNTYYLFNFIHLFNNRLGVSLQDEVLTSLIAQELFDLER
ncbi:lantibiotic dehydratase C-terminal domain-containing protein [Streptococcus pseudoporcinus]|uniref:Thiopeptide-type bacteriocin biosynthesis domain n=1 Tax=Streptococcus pseudoporcinus TaxID=361101 RepID=A0A4U9XW71_9STRE|nr:lantibiotic dehydratase C-terminal domain-containing protein [Streptococcus pseudoporcinus]VTS16961.1 thiopeptide-type bacteriocin biosynthesis domain [Streptococcus pseudoporcinus]VUC68138.1 thiopeptide-type bacteriocin biosynthesis domain [Streptococcus pseudoporcinus]VUC99016.1 thiopeptide-type bacteriocin biosynthesis domain [Streptococcus pseudoporcinus]VUC99408.1 thiopeptide-type bacteriocin biosynthesis domain [Streptococcus pseudoporcinus]